MKILVSACLLGKNCKYNGGNNRNEAVIRFVEGHEAIAVCPEELGGLPTPRVPAEIVNGIVTDKNGKNVDEEFRRGARLALEKALEEPVELAILQSRSPSCGVRQIYDGTFGGVKKDGQGVFAELLSQAGIRTVDAEALEESGKGALSNITEE